MQVSSSGQLGFAPDEPYGTDSVSTPTSRSRSATCRCTTAPTPEAPFVNLKKRLKEFARSETRAALVQSVVQCAGLALSAKSLAGLLAAPAAIAGPENAAVIATMKVVYDEVKSLEGLNSDPINDLQAKADACGSTLIWFFFAYKTFSDPPATGVDEVPVPGTVTLAPPPSLCASSAGSAHAACLTLVSHEEAVTLALARVASAYGAISTAIDRLSQAQATGDASASALQSAVLEALQLELAQNLDSLTATERTLGALLGHYFGRLRVPGQRDQPDRGVRPGAAATPRHPCERDHERAGRALIRLRARSAPSFQRRRGDRAFDHPRRSQGAGCGAHKRRIRGEAGRRYRSRSLEEVRRRRCWPRRSCRAAAGLRGRAPCGRALSRARLTPATPGAL